MDELSNLPWIEKYRPKRLDEIIGQSAIVERLKAFVKTKNFPNMIFSGPAGVGKTTAAIAFANELYGNDMQSYFLETNASDARGIDVIRGRIKEFAKTMPLQSSLIKIAFLDEADALTPEAQHALRRTMERYSETTRFVFSANYASKIIEPIQSRCVVLRFRPLNEEQVKTYIKRIEKGEGLQIDDKAVEALIYVGEGDLRKLTNVLQGASAMNAHITEKEVYDIASRARPKEIVSMLRYALSGDFTRARGELDTLMLENGMSGEDILLQCYREALNIQASDEQKLELIKEIGDCNYKIVEGANERIQLEAMLARMAAIGKPTIQ
ncbi:MAG: replication factor C small subunit, partial [Candidatus Micrarchaeia archaeon]